MYGRSHWWDFSSFDAHRAVDIIGPDANIKGLYIVATVRQSADIDDHDAFNWQCSRWL